MMRDTAYQTGVRVLAVLFLFVPDELVIREKNTFLLRYVCHTLGVFYGVLYRHAAAAAFKCYIVADARLVKKAVERACHRRKIARAGGNKHHRQDHKQQYDDVHCFFSFQVAFQNVKKHTHSPFLPFIVSQKPFL